VFLFTAQFLGQTSGVRGSSLRILVSSTQLVQLILEVDLSHRTRITVYVTSSNEESLKVSSLTSIRVCNLIKLNLSIELSAV
jgi:hypothetical protein